MTPEAAQGGATLPTIGAWRTSAAPPAFSAKGLTRSVERVREPVHVVRDGREGRLGAAFGGQVVPAPQGNGAAEYPLLATLPPLYPEWLGDRSFLETHHVRFPYATGAMANGIASAALVVEVARAGMLAFFGAAGLSLERVEKGLADIESALAGGDVSWGSNLIHSPNEPDLEQAVVDLYLRRGVRRLCASAFMSLTPRVVQYAATGLSADAGGRIRRRHHVLAKISRPEVARGFVSPPPAEMLRALFDQRRLTAAEAELAARVPVAQDITVESDSGGHTDNRPLAALFPTIRALVDEHQARHGYLDRIRVGAAGGLGTPTAVAAAFALGAAYVLTGSVNQAAVESGLSDEGRRMLAEADIADVIMAPAADMFELGVKVQVLKRGTMFGVRAQRLYDLYTRYDALESMPDAERVRLEKEVLGASVDEVWRETRRFFEARDPREVAKADKEPRHRMALVFRWYLGKSSKWAIDGDPARRLDYQIWCGPAMGAFNAWTAGSFLGDPRQRRVVQIARNLLEGAATVTRAHQLRTYGVAIPPSAFDYRPRELA
jgi:trans-AT polyketide synthase, acyltransferase and oxidoreductase domains